MKVIQKSFSKLFTFMLAVTMMVLLAPTQINAEAITGVITNVQKYGNVEMDINPQALLDAGFKLGDVLEVNTGKEKVEMPFVTSYSDVDIGNPLVRNDRDNDLLVVAINMRNFSKKFDVKVGDKLTFEVKEPAGYLNEYELRQLKRTNERSDYASDVIFANFRPINTTGIAPGVLYRSSNPINNEIGRAKYANDLVKEAGIQTVLNLADNKEEIESYIKDEKFASYYYKNLVDHGDVILLDMTIDVNSEDFSKKLVRGLEFMATRKGPYLLHCTEGKDRAGFVSAVLEGLMGASMDEIVEDYMTTYENYYHVEKGSEQYYKIAKANIVAEMTVTVFGLPKGADISKVNIAEATEKYLLRIGVSQKAIDQIKHNLATKSLNKVSLFKAA